MQHISDSAGFSPNGHTAAHVVLTQQKDNSTGSNNYLSCTGDVDLAISTSSLNQRCITPIPIKKAPCKSIQNFFWQARKDFNTNQSRNITDHQCEQQVIRSLKKIYFLWFSHPSRLLQNLDLDKFFKDNTKKNVDDFERCIMGCLNKADFYTSQERSYIVSRLCCLLINNASQISIIKEYGDVITGDDLAYIASHSPIEITQQLCNMYHHKIPAEAVFEIYKSHPQFVIKNFNQYDWFEKPEEWFHFLRICNENIALAEKIYCSNMFFPYMELGHTIALVYPHKMLRESFYPRFLSKLNDNDTSLTPSSWSKEDGDIWKVLLGHSYWVEKSIKVIDKIEKQFAKDDFAEILALIISHPERDHIAGIEDIITQENLKLIMACDSASWALCSKPPSLFFDHIADYAKNMSADLYGLLLECNLQSVRELLQARKGLSITSLAQMADAYPDTIGVACVELFSGLSDSNQNDLLTQLLNPSMLGLMRKKFGKLYSENTAPYQEATGRLQQLLNNESYSQQLDIKHLYKLQYRYPCLTKLRLAFLKNSKSTLITNDDVFNSPIHPCRDGPQLFFDMVQSIELSDEARLQLCIQ